MMARKFLFLVCSALIISCSTQTPRFEWIHAETTGIDFINALVEDDSFNIMQNEYMYNGGGVGIADLNKDGLPDIIFTGNQVLSRIYLNQGNFKFKDITSNFQGLTNSQWYSGVAVVDINADGWADIYLTSTNSPDPEKRKNRLWVNQGLDQDGIPYFKEMAEAYGIADEGYSVHAAFFDYDLDGDLDLYVLNNIVSKAIPTNYRDKIKDGTAINNDQFYRNNGDGTFTQVTEEAGIIYEGYGLGIAVGDINKDGYPDVYVSNDYISNDILYLNQRDGTFRNATKEYVSHQSRFSMGNDLADINNDGHPEIITLDMLPEQYFRKKQTINGNSYFVYVNNDKFGYEPQYVRNMLHLHNGFRNGELLPYSEIGQLAGVYQTEWSWSPLFADVDNDGDRDLIITNGFPKDLTDKDFTNYKAQVYGFVADDAHIISKIPIVKVPNYIYENTGDYKFENRSEAWGFREPSFSNGAAFADLDNDGDLDYVVNNIDDPAFVFRNNTIGKINDSPNYLRISLEGKSKNTLGIGAKVEVWSANSYQFHEQHLSRGYISSVDPVVHFGFPSKVANLIIDSVRITWPAGTSQQFTSVKSNQLLKVNEADAVDAGLSGSKQSERLLFEPVKGLLQYLHRENDFIDFFQNQRIIQHKFSQIGPCVAAGDLNGDGLDDVLIGASDGTPSAVYLNSRGSFISKQVEGLTGARSCSEADVLIIDVDGDGDNDVITISGGYANQNESDYKHFLYRNTNGKFVKEPLPLPPFSGSVVRAFDFDKDGDPDLFIGARIKMGNFPYAPASYLLINENGTFKTSAELTFDIGMVTDAVWSDYNSDGWHDLILTREWQSLLILENHQGKSFAPQAPASLKSLSGFWYSITAADLDNDGDDDYVIGNLGENHRFNVSEKYPMRLYAIDIDENGIIDPISTGYWKDKNGTMQEYPVNYLDELFSQSPFFRKRFTSYTQFSYATMDSIVDTRVVPEEKKFSVNTTASYILWNDKGTFSWDRLPTLAQASPIRKSIIRDFNGDGLADILLTGNDNSFDVSTGYYNANKGLIILGKGNRQFQVLPSAQSGLLLQGQVNSLVLINGESPLLVAGINRDSLAVYKINKPVSPNP